MKVGQYFIWCSYGENSVAYFLDHHVYLAATPRGSTDMHGCHLTTLCVIQILSLSSFLSAQYGSPTDMWNYHLAIIVKEGTGPTGFSERGCCGSSVPV